MNIFKSLLAFYISLFTPIFIIWYNTKMHMIGSGMFCLLLFIYLTIYRTLICNLRLLANNKITQKQFWKNCTPARVDKYFWFLFFNIDVHKTSSSDQK
jgi:hypothetical protein